MTERDHDAEFRELLDRAAQLRKSIEPPRDLWPGIEARIAGKRPGTGEGGRGRNRALWLFIPLAAAAALALLLLGRRVPRLGGGAWEVTRLTGVPLVGAAPLAATGALRVGDWLETDDSSRAVIQVGDIGRVEVKPDTRIRLVRAQRTDHRLALERGEIYAKVDAPPRLFFVETPAGTGPIPGPAGYVEFDGGGRRSIVPLGFRADTRRGFGPGTPYAEDAPEELRRALAAFDFANGGPAAVRRALAAARSEDAVSLWHLLGRVDLSLRREVYDRLSSLVPPPPPPGVAREDVLRLDPLTLQTYWNTIRRIAWRKTILRGIRDIDPRTGTAR